MRRLSLATAFQTALLGLTIALAAVAAFGVASLYSSRQRYEDRLSDALHLQTGAGRLLAAGVVEEATLRLTPQGAAGRAARVRARQAYLAALAPTRDLAAGDPASAAFVEQAAQNQARLRRDPGARGAPLSARAPLVRLSARQDQRIADARQTARDSSRRAFTAIIAGGGLAVFLALASVTALLGAVRRPLDALVTASEQLAEGHPEVRVEEEGPEELQVLARSFNAMAGDIQAASARVEAERRRLDLTVRSLGDALVLLDADGTVTAANPRAAELVPDLRPGAHTGAGPGAVRLPVPLADALDQEVVVERGDLTLAVTAATMEQSGGHVLTVRDVSERARLERLKSEFVATASHELRSPLTSIKGFVELLAESDGLTDRQRDFLEIVHVSTDRLVDLANDLLDVARVEAGAVEIHRRPTDIAELVEEVTQMLRPRLADRDQELTVDVPDDLPRGLVDPARLRQVLTNLLTNAHLYTPDGGRIAVRVRADVHALVLAVSDTGRGMNADEVQHVFDRFYRAGGGADGTGTGLGLAIVKALVDLHGGHVDVQSAPGEGSTFTVHLPLALEIDRPAAGGRHLEGKHVLVVDDEHEVATLVARHLAARGVTTDVVHTGAEALDLLRHQRYDAVTLDILMPGMGGLELLRALRADEALRDLPVVVVSVFSGREALRGEWVVGKPIDPDELADALGAAMVASRVRVLVAGREALRHRLGTALTDLGIAHDWVTTPDGAAQACARRFYEVAVVDSGLPDADGAVGVIELRGRRAHRAVLLAVDPEHGAPITAGEAEAVPVDDVGAVIVGLLDPGALRSGPDGRPADSE